MSGPGRLIVGRVAKAHGIRGEVAVEVLSDDPQRFAPGARLLHGADELEVETVRPHQGRLLVKFASVPDRTAAEALRGARLEVEASRAWQPPEGSYFPHQLEGFDVVGPDGARLGALVRVEESPANDLWVVETGEGEVLVPAVRQIVVGVDLAARRIVVDPPEGLF